MVAAAVLASGIMRRMIRHDGLVLEKMRTLFDLGLGEIFGFWYLSSSLSLIFGVF